MLVEYELSNRFLPPATVTSTLITCNSVDFLVLSWQGASRKPSLASAGIDSPSFTGEFSINQTWLYISRFASVGLPHIFALPRACIGSANDESFESESPYYIH